MDAASASLRVAGWTTSTGPSASSSPAVHATSSCTSLTTAPLRDARRRRAPIPSPPGASRHPEARRAFRPRGVAHYEHAFCSPRRGIPMNRRPSGGGQLILFPGAVAGAPAASPGRRRRPRPASRSARMAERLDALAAAAEREAAGEPAGGRRHRGPRRPGPGVRRPPRGGAPAGGADGGRRRPRRSPRGRLREAFSPRLALHASGSRT